jgi:alpha-N-arabinofuranosidase
MWKVHHDATMLPIHLDSEAYSNGGANIPALSASASSDGDGNINITLCHTNPSQVTKLELDLRGAIFGNVTGRILSAPTLQAHNTFEAPETLVPREMNPDEFEIVGNKLVINLPPACVAAIRISGQ